MFATVKLFDVLCIMFVFKGAVAIKLAQDDHKGKAESESAAKRTRTCQRRRCENTT